MRRLILLILLIPLLTSCATIGQRESSVTLPTGEVYVVRCQHDATMEYRNGDVSVRVNNQGKPGPIDSLIALMSLAFVKTADTVK